MVIEWEDVIKVYIAVGDTKDQNRHDAFNLMMTPLERLLPEMRQERQGEGLYQLCSAYREMFRNTYIHYSPTKLWAKYEAQENTLYSGGGLLETRPPSWENRLSLDVAYGYYLFAEDSLETTLLPPLFHQTSWSDKGMLSVARFDIGNWFRPIAPSFHLWKGINEITIPEGEPLMYFQFNTTSKIEFIPYRLTPEIYSLSLSCTKQSHFKPFQSLSDKYRQFQAKKWRRLILSKIKENLI